MSAGALQNRRSHSLSVIARLHADVTPEEAQRDMDRVVDGLRDVYPEFLTGWGANVVSLTDELVGSIRPALLVLMGAVGFVLLIAAVNVANLMLTRTVAEQREMSIRTALGAGRGRLVQVRGRSNRPSCSCACRRCRECPSHHLFPRSRRTRSGRRGRSPRHG